MKRLEKEVCESRKRYGASRCLQGQRRKEYMMEMENSNGWIGGHGEWQTFRGKTWPKRQTMPLAALPPGTIHSCFNIIDFILYAVLYISVTIL